MESRLREDWATEDSLPPLNVRPSLIKRARKREVFRGKDENSWRITGDTKLSDTRPQYFVGLEDGKYFCSCQTSMGGEYRRNCSHKVAVMLCRREEMEYAGEMQEEPEPEPPQELTLLDIQPAAPDQAEDDSGSPIAPVVPLLPQRVGDSKGVEFSLPDEAPPLTHPMFGSIPMPHQFREYREGQWEAVKETVEFFQDGYKVVFLSAPTGSGKTLIGESIRRLHAGSVPTPFLCTTKSLQNQIEKDFSYGRVIKGRANYRTELRNDLTAEDCDGSWSQGPDSCSWCTSLHTCAYQVAKNEAASAPLGILNTAYFLHETTGDGSRFFGRDLVIIDEADTLENQLMSHVETVIGPRLRKKLKVDTIPKRTVADDWERWLTQEVIPAIDKYRLELSKQSSMFGASVKARRELRRMGQIKARIKQMLRDGDGDLGDNWVMTGYEGKDVAEATVVFKPVRVAEVARSVLWDRGNQFLLMSATLISAEQMAEDLGLEHGEWAYVEMDSTFPVENRPVFSVGKTRVTQKTKEEAYPILVDQVAEIVADHPFARILVHTVSYELTRHLYTYLADRRIMTYWSAQERDRALARFLEQPNAVLLAPSFERGIDLPGEECEVIIIAKVPYPYLGDKMVKARMYSKGGQKWYAVQTIRAIAQMTGRGMRGRSDWCDTYILDQQFNKLFREHKRLFPNWWKEALVISRNHPKSRELVRAAEKRKRKRLARNNGK